MTSPYAIGPTVMLRPVEPADVLPLYRMAGSSLGSTWRTRGASLSPAVFEAHLWDGVFAQFTICDRRDDTAIVGLVSAINPDLRREIASLSLLTTGSLGAGPSTIAGEAMELFCEHLFVRAGLRKLMIESFAVDLPSIARLGRLATMMRPQGVLEQHDRSPSGELCDRHIYAMFQSDYLADLSRRMARPERQTGEAPIAFPEFATAVVREFLDDTSIDHRPGGLELVADLGMDSLSLVECALWIEERFDARVDHEGLAGAVTLQDLHECVSR